jgi:predicted ThiF/HesA family dinucleotide-utilizing enzyme
MNLIFHNGEKLYKKDTEKVDECIKIFNNFGIKVAEYQKQQINPLVRYRLYGDDFRVEIIPRNITEKCVILINDYDENQDFESNITIDFTKDELEQLINLLQTARNNMK